MEKILREDPQLAKKLLHHYADQKDNQRLNLCLDALAQKSDPLSQKTEVLEVDDNYKATLRQVLEKVYQKGKAYYLVGSGSQVQVKLVSIDPGPGAYLGEVNYLNCLNGCIQAKLYFYPIRKGKSMYTIAWNYGTFSDCISFTIDGEPIGWKSID